MHQLSPELIHELELLRHEFHRFPEVSGQEENTAKHVQQILERAGADRLWLKLGGHGVAAEFCGSEAGPTVLLRCELDALPITEKSTLSYRSEIEGKGHLCGHDGHMCMVLGVALHLKQSGAGGLRPERGRLVLLFQPAEETGAGASAVINDPRWPEIRPDYAFAFHNVPGQALGQIGLRTGHANCASRGMQILLHGKSSHAAAPEDGHSPAAAIAQLIQSVPELCSGSVSDKNFGLCTLTHACLGEATFGIAPGEGEVRLTLRSTTDTRMQAMIEQVQGMLDSLDRQIGSTVHWHDIFQATVNSAAATDIARAAALSKGLCTHEMKHPMRWSEDFGQLHLDGVESSMMFLGAGTEQPQLHNPDYNFPDALLSTGTELFLGIVDHVLGIKAH